MRLCMYVCMYVCTGCFAIYPKKHPIDTVSPYPPALHPEYDLETFRRGSNNKNAHSVWSATTPAFRAPENVGLRKIKYVRFVAFWTELVETP